MRSTAVSAESKDPDEAGRLERSSSVDEGPPQQSRKAPRERKIGEGVLSDGPNAQGVSQRPLESSRPNEDSEGNAARE